MEVIRGILQNPFRGTPQRTAVAIGNFDGVHLGHQEIIRLLRRKAQGFGALPTVVYTFRPHPQIALRPEKKMELLTSYEEKLLILEKLGVDYVIEEPFSREFSSTPAEVFFQTILVEELKAKSVVVGYDFAFGKGRQGHLDSLKVFCSKSQVELVVVPRYEMGETAVSSSKIRQALSEGHLEFATQLMGRAFSYDGVVVRGDGRGRSIGVPTANFKQISKSGEKLTLPFGVYVTRSLWKDASGEHSAPSITNVGVRPTFQSQEDLASQTHAEPYFLVETHLLGVQLDLYGVELKVEFLKYLRSEKKFSDAAPLKSQIKLDIENAQKYHAESSH